MKELGFLMPVIAAVILVMFFLRNFFSSHRCFFFIPGTASFNIMWGITFYASYAFLRTEGEVLRLLWGTFIATLLIAIFLLAQIRRFFLTRSLHLLSPLLLRIVNAALTRQQHCNGTENLSRSQAMSIIGLHASAASDPKLIRTRLGELRDLSSRTPGLSPYFQELLEKVSETFNLE